MTRKNSLARLKKKFIFILKGIVLAIILFITLFPILWLVKTSVASTEDIQSGLAFNIKAVNFSHYRQLFVEKGFDTALKNSMINSL